MKPEATAKLLARAGVFGLWITHVAVAPAVLKTIWKHLDL
jgi:hypothetical protein